VVSAHAEVQYKTTEYYTPEQERTLAWDDPQLAIDWPLEGAPLLSAKDRDGARFEMAEVFE
jgi:dTDP-4-dehydrorhamnose 3,5-epimerase